VYFFAARMAEFLKQSLDVRLMGFLQDIRFIAG
jgi:hypothetical protein